MKEFLVSNILERYTRSDREIILSAINGLYAAARGGAHGGATARPKPHPLRVASLSVSLVSLLFPRAHRRHAQVEQGHKELEW